MRAYLIVALYDSVEFAPRPAWYRSQRSDVSWQKITDDARRIPDADLNMVELADAGGRINRLSFHEECADGVKGRERLILARLMQGFEDCAVEPARPKVAACV